MRNVTKQADGSLTVRCVQCHQDKPISATEAQIREWQITGKHIQVVMANVPAAERELLISGVCGKCWDALFANDEED
jgi:hypothetical protein